MISTPVITAIVIAVLVALAFSGGFALSDWRMAARIQQLNNDQIEAPKYECILRRQP